MLRSFIAFCAALIAKPGNSPAPSDAQAARNPARTVVQPGDLLVQRDEVGWSAVKVLEVDHDLEGAATAHCLAFELLATRPTVDSLQRTKVRIGHAPIDARSFETDWELLGNQAPSSEELAGFMSYLKAADFQRYLELSGQDSAEVIRKANAHYDLANEKSQQGQHLEAIAEYDRAVEIFPLFFEALDNRAFSYMVLGRFDEALEDFGQSLRVHPDGMTAFFSRGECLMKLGRLDAADEVFRTGQVRFAAQRELFAEFLQKTRALRKQKGR